VILTVIPVMFPAMAMNDGISDIYDDSGDGDDDFGGGGRRRRTRLARAKIPSARVKNSVNSCEGFR
jgi:hypothetical protein